MNLKTTTTTQTKSELPNATRIVEIIREMTGLTYV
jgi:hypothetical protein